jgi:hypothetical protein
MKHHFGDFLDRTGDYWKMTPNRDRYQLMMHNFSNLDSSIKAITISKDHTNWKEILKLRNLEELTIHEGTKEQFQAIINLKNLKRLRVTHLRPKQIDPIGELENLEELVLEYVSGFSDLSPLTNLDKLKSCHFENLRKVTDFSPLSKVKKLKYLRIDGTLDWKQPIDNFEFLKDLKNLEVISLGQVICKSNYPILLRLTGLKNLKKIKIPVNMFPSEEYALLQTAIPEIEGTQWEPIAIWPNRFIELDKDDPRMKLSKEELNLQHPKVRILYDGRRNISDPDYEWFEFIGKRAGRIKCDSKNAKKKCDEFSIKYEAMKAKAKKLLMKKADNT